MKSDIEFNPTPAFYQQVYLAVKDAMTEHLSAQHPQAQQSDYAEIAEELYQELLLAERTMAAPTCERVHKLLRKYENLLSAVKGK